MSNAWLSRVDVWVDIEDKEPIRFDLRPGELFQFAEVFREVVQMPEDVRRLIRKYPQFESEVNHQAMMDTYERRLITAAMDRCKGNQSHAAEYLKMKRSTLIAACKRLNIDIAQIPENAALLLNMTASLDELRAKGDKARTEHEIAKRIDEAKELVEALYARKKAIMREDLRLLKGGTVADEERVKQAG